MQAARDLQGGGKFRGLESGGRFGRVGVSREVWRGAYCWLSEEELRLEGGEVFVVSMLDGLIIVGSTHFLN